MPVVAANFRFANAKFARSTLEQVARKILTEREYWKQQGIHVSGTMARFDGAGVTVLVRRADNRTLAAMRQRYDFEDITLEAEINITPVPGR